MATEELKFELGKSETGTNCTDEELLLVANVP
jgi:hypothetical protein